MQATRCARVRPASCVAAKGQPVEVVMPDITSLNQNDKKAIYVNEPGLYDVLLGSDKEEAVLAIC